MIYIQGIVYLDFLVGGKPIGQATNLFKDIMLVESVASLCASAKISLNDHADVLKKQFAFSDGNSFSIIMGKDPADIRTTERKYVLFSVKPSPLSGYDSGSELLAYSNFPSYITKSNRASYKGTSEDVLRRVAEENGLTFTGPSDDGSTAPTDSQVWLNSCQSPALFAQHQVARHGYTDDSSGMVLAVTSLGEMKYRNIVDLALTPPEKVDHYFLHNAAYSGEESSKLIYSVREARYKSDAGLMNNYINYGAIRAGPNLTGEHDVYDKVDVAIGDTDYLVINKDISDAVGKTARIDYSNVDCGNTHPNYYKAFNQNIRVLAMFTERISLITYEPTAVGILDPVIFKQTNVSNTEPAKETDVYIVLGKTIMIHNGQNYVERIELGRMTVKEPGMVNLIGGSSSLTEDIMAQQLPHGLPQSNYDVASPSYANNLARANVLGDRIQRNTQASTNAVSNLPNVITRMDNTVPSIAALVDLSSRLTPPPVVNPPPPPVVDPEDLLDPGNADWATPATKPWNGKDWATWNNDVTSGSANIVPGGDSGSLAIALATSYPTMKSLNTELTDLNLNMAVVAGSFEEAFSEVMNTDSSSGASIDPYAPQVISSQHRAIMNSMFNAPGGPVDTVIGASLPIVSVVDSVNQVYCTSLSQMPPSFVTINTPTGPSFPVLKVPTTSIVSEVESMNLNYRNMLMSIARIWNILVSSQYAQAPVIDAGNWKYIIAVLNSSTLTISGIPKSTRTVADEFRAESIKLNDISKPRWVTIEPPESEFKSVNPALLGALMQKLRMVRRQSNDPDQYVRSTR